MQIAMLVAFLNRSPLIPIALLLILGMFGGRLTARWRLPEILGFLMVGAVLSPHATGLLTAATIDVLKPLADVAMAIVLFQIGAHLKLARLRRIGLPSLGAALIQAMITFGLVTLGTWWINPTVALLLGGIAIAGATPTTFAVAGETRSRGSLTRRLLVVVILSDVLAVVFLRVLLAATGGIALTAALAQTVGSVVLGTLLGFGLIWIARRYAEPNRLLSLCLGVLVLVVGLARNSGLSALLLSLTLGVIVANFSTQSRALLSSLRVLLTPAHILFFALAGCHLNLASLAEVGLLGAIAALLRTFGKIFGGAVGARLMRFPRANGFHLGLGLLPQATVALALLARVTEAFPSYATQITSVILGGVLIFETVGVLALRFALGRSGEVPQATAKT